jgi:hypothetical protein
MSNEYKPGADISESAEIWTEEMQAVFDQLVSQFDRLISQRDKLAEGLRSISLNSCCDQCQQAKLVASRQTLKDAWVES